jgi:predicted alpha/beta-fold hydrolase
MAIRLCHNFSFVCVDYRSVSNPFDVRCATQSLESFPSRQLYNRHITQRLRALLTVNKGVFEKASPSLLDWAAVEAAQTIRQFDERVIVPMFEYQDLAAYYNGWALAHIFLC